MGLKCLVELKTRKAVKMQNKFDFFRSLVNSELFIVCCGDRGIRFQSFRSFFVEFLRSKIVFRLSANNIVFSKFIASSPDNFKLQNSHSR